MAKTVLYLDSAEVDDMRRFWAESQRRWMASAPHVPYQIWVMCVKMPDPEQRRQAMEMWGIPDVS